MYAVCIPQRMPATISFSGDFQVGQQVLVEVECVFDEGLVVCYKSDPNGFIARGALLLIPSSPKPQ